jgi:hypothetical protein
MQVDSYKSIYYACLFITSLRSIADSNIKLPKVFTYKAVENSPGEPHALALMYPD